MWKVLTTDLFDHWYSALNESERASVLASLLLLREKGPHLGRPHVDTVKASRFKNMKELRIQNKGQPIRAFFAFDPSRQAIMLCAGNKSGNEKRFYKQMIPLADSEFEKYLKD